MAVHRPSTQTPAVHSRGGGVEYNLAAVHSTRELSSGCPEAAPRSPEAAPRSPEARSPSRRTLAGLPDSRDALPRARRLNSERGAASTGAERRELLFFLNSCFAGVATSGHCESRLGARGSRAPVVHSRGHGD